MGVVGNRIIKGIEVEEVIKLLNKAYADEWLAYYQYFIEAKAINGIMSESVVTELTQHATDELNHANLVADRIVQLGGTPLLHPKEWFDACNCTYYAPEKSDVISILEDSIKGEQCAIETYSDLVEITQGKDIVTYNMVSQILADEVEHEEDLQSLYDNIKGFMGSMRG